MLFPRMLLTGLVTAAALALPAPDATAQQRIDGTFPFQTDPAKKYSIYVPSAYQEGTPHRLMIGFHPLNTARWNAESWCDTLIVFAEQNELLLACPDGGADGAVDDPIDFAFTEALLDSVADWYSIDATKIYAMGFSWGGRATYTFGLTHAETFGGFVPIGAAINGTSEVNGIIQNADGKPFYIVHGASDSPNVRYWPIRTALINNGAIVNSLLMPGVGHTIDFPNRNAILGVAFQWVDSVNCAIVTTGIDDSLEDTPAVANLEEVLRVARHPVSAGGRIEFQLDRSRLPLGSDDDLTLEVFDVRGRRVGEWALGSASSSVPAPALRGTYALRLRGAGRSWKGKLVVN